MCHLRDRVRIGFESLSGVIVRVDHAGCEDQAAGVDHAIEQYCCPDRELLAVLQLFRAQQQVRPGERHISAEWRTRQARGPISFTLHWLPFIDEVSTPTRALTALFFAPDHPDTIQYAQYFGLVEGSTWLERCCCSFSQARCWR